MTGEELKLKLKNFSESQSPWKKSAGTVLIVIGFLALITPLTPGSWLMFVGLELLGFRIALWEKFKNWFWKL